ncbi:hypothetical protein [Sorangium sp. So ce233]|uniref:hypothetical protein n=1 Tax=Sorangium sp. So ce233 TaxID=3133290 RepID=UPI003F5D56C7
MILYRMLTGRHPFEGDSITAVTAAIMMDTPTSLLTLRPDLPPAVGALVSRCLAKDPAVRVQSVTEIGRVLAPFGTQRARLSFESIDRLLPEPAARAGYPPAAGPGALGTSSPSWGEAPVAPEAATAPTPVRPGTPSSPGGEAAGAAHATLPHASWGNTTATRRGRARPAAAWRCSPAPPERSSWPGSSWRGA